MNERTKAEAKTKAGYRENYAMKHGTPTKKIENGETLYIFTYSDKNQYQDANGATYNATRKAWTN